jgi:hypothetical protein
MSPEKTKILFESFPDLFGPAEFKNDIHQFLMGFGFECGDGWFDLVFDCFKRISEADCETMIVQVKEKFGGLRVYCRTYCEAVKRFIKEAEARSLITCEVCGAAGDTKSDNGWMVTLCDSCLEKRKADQVQGFHDPL